MGLVGADRRGHSLESRMEYVPEGSAMSGERVDGGGVLRYVIQKEHYVQSPGS